MKNETIKNKIVSLGSMLLIALVLVSCNDNPIDAGVEPSEPENTTPPKSNDADMARVVALYYQSHSRYAKNNGGGNFTADDLLSKSGETQQYAHDLFVPSFTIIGDGRTAIGQETSAWKKNQFGYDDIYAWSGLGWDNNHNLIFSNGKDLGSGNINSGLNKNPNKPYSMALGGWPKDDNMLDPLRTGGFDRLGYSDADLTEFVNNIGNNTNQGARVVRKPNEISVDYEFPTTPQQAGFMTKIVKKISENTEFKVNIAIGPNNKKNLSILEFSELDKYVHSFEIMTYDYHGMWDTKTGHHTGLYSNTTGVESQPVDFSPDYNIHSQVEYVKAKGIAPSKIKVGIALYGRFWTGVTFPATINPNEPHFSATGAAVSGLDTNKWNDKINVILYRDILSEVTTAKGWETYYDDTAKASFAINRSKGMFLSYDSERSIADKAQYIKDNGLGGVIIWDALGAQDTDILKYITSKVH